MNLLEVKKRLEEIFNKEPMDGKKRNIVFRIATWFIAFRRCDSKGRERKIYIPYKSGKILRVPLWYKQAGIKKGKGRAE